MGEREYKMIHEIKNQHGKHIIDEEIRDEIIYAIEKDMTYTYHDGIRIDIVKDVKTEKGRETLVRVDGIDE